MEFPIAGITVNPILLAGIGFLVGILGGFFGVGGGFIAGPFMFWAGVPMNFVVGTDLAHMTGKSIVAAKRHRALGHVDIKLGAYMVVATIIGVEIGAQILEGLERAGNVDFVIGIVYILILLSISMFTAWESMRALRMIRTDQIDVKDAVGFEGLTKRVHGIKLRPMISIPTHVAVGTDLFEIVFSAGYGTITHAIKGNVDILMALVMQTGAAIGAQIGATSTRFFAGPKIRLFFSALPFLGAVMVIIRLFSGMGMH